MGKTKKAKLGEETPVEVKPFQIVGAQLNDAICNYSYEVMTGPTAGETHNVKGVNVVHDDLRDAFQTFNRHLAAIDDGFDEQPIGNIDQMENSIITGQYDVSGFKIKGTDENESIILSGNKYVKSIHSRNDVTTARVALDQHSAYKWYNELKSAADVVRAEVEAYMHGKCTPKDETEVLSKKGKQKNLLTEIADAEGEFESDLDKNKL